MAYPNSQKLQYKNMSDIHKLLGLLTEGKKSQSVGSKSLLRNKKQDRIYVMKGWIKYIEGFRSKFSHWGFFGRKVLSSPPL